METHQTCVQEQPAPTTPTENTQPAPLSPEFPAGQSANQLHPGTPVPPRPALAEPQAHPTPAPPDASRTPLVAPSTPPVAPSIPPGQAVPLVPPQPQAGPSVPGRQLYDPGEAAQIARCLTDDGFDPEYILLFGKLAGGTPHSDAMAYDLLLVVREQPACDWMGVKRILRYRMPVKRREITYINPYIATLHYVQSNPLPFLYFAHAEGKLLYCSDHCCFRRPKRRIDFAAAYADAKYHYDRFRMLGDKFLMQARDAFRKRRNWRMAAFSRRRPRYTFIMRCTTSTTARNAAATIRWSSTNGCGRSRPR